MLSLEGVTRAPVDAGFQGVLEVPGGLRFFGGYGFMPSAYLGRVMGLASAISGDPVLATVLEDGFASGRVWRIGGGWRPFERVGVYLDFGYARASLAGAIDTSAFAPDLGVSGRYGVASTLGLGFVEVGYQAKIAQRVVLAVALGATKVMDAETSITPEAGSAQDARLNDAAGLVDQGLEEYGFTPTLALRLGVDLI
jgi:hypothetical protein